MIITGFLVNIAVGTMKDVTEPTTRAQGVRSMDMLLPPGTRVCEPTSVEVVNGG